MGIRRKKTGIFLAALLLMPFVFSCPAYGGEWRKTEEEAWKYEEEQAFVTGWKEIDGIWYYFNDSGIMETGWLYTGDKWYYLDEESGAWVKKPAINKESACHLLENALKKADLYQDEEMPLLYKVESEDEKTVTVLVQIEKNPLWYTTINSYDVIRKTGTAKGAVGDSLELYD